MPLHIMSYVVFFDKISSMISLDFSGSFMDSISAVTLGHISSDTVYSNLLSSADHSHYDAQSNTMYLTATVSTSVATFLFTLIKSFLLC